MDTDTVGVVNTINVHDGTMCVADRSFFLDIGTPVVIVEAEGHGAPPPQTPAKALKSKDMGKSGDLFGVEHPRRETGCWRETLPTQVDRVPHGRCQLVARAAYM